MISIADIDRERLRNNIKECDRLKKELVLKIKRLKSRFNAGELSISEYEFLLNNLLKGRPLDYWLEYYDNYKKDALEILKTTKVEPYVVTSSENIATRPKNRALALVVVSLSLILVVFLGYTGLVTYEPSTVEMPWNHSWDNSSAILRVSMDGNVIDFDASRFVEDDKVVFDTKELSFNETGDVYVDLLIDDVLVDSAQIKIKADEAPANGSDATVETGNETNATMGNETAVNESSGDVANQTIDNETNVTSGDEINVTISNETEVNESSGDAVNQTIGNETDITLGNETNVTIGNETMLNQTINETNQTLTNATNMTLGNVTNMTLGNETMLNESLNISGALNISLELVDINYSLNSWTVKVKLVGNLDNLDVMLDNGRFYQGFRKGKSLKLKKLDLNLLKEDTLKFDSAESKDSKLGYDLSENSVKINLTENVSELVLGFTKLKGSGYNLTLYYGNISLNISLDPKQLDKVMIKGCLKGLLSKKFGKFRVGLDKNCLGESNIIDVENLVLDLENRKISSNGKGIGFKVNKKGFRLENAAIEDFEEGIVIDAGGEDYMLSNLVVKKNQKGIKIKNAKNLILKDLVIDNNADVGLIIENVTDVSFDNVAVSNSNRCVMIKDSHIKKIKIHTFGCKEYAVLYEVKGKIIKMVNP